MLHNKFINNNWARIPLFLLALTATFMLFGAGKAHALQITAKFNDRATIEITNITLDNPTDDLSDEAKDAGRGPDGKVDAGMIQDWANQQLKGVYSRGDLLSANKNYVKTGCDGHNNLIAPANNNEAGIDQGDFKIGTEHDGNVVTGGVINHFWVQTKNPNKASVCVDLVRIQPESVYPIHVDNPNNANKIWFVYDQPEDNSPVKSIFRVDNRGTYTLASPLRYNGTNTCTRSNDLENVVLQTALNGRTQALFDPCTNLSAQIAVVISPKGDAGAGGTVTAAGGGNKKVECESTPFSLSWIFCPMVNALASASDGIYDNVIQPALATDSINTDAQDADNYVFKAWSTLRIFGNILLIIGILVIVFGQAIGGGLVDAYTAKKVMPRILLAAVMINLSFYICALAIDITNILGQGLNTLLTSVISNGGGADTIHLTLNGGASGLGIAAVAGGAWLLAGGAAEALMVLFLFVLLPALLALLGVALTLIIRRGLILLLIIISPVAVALYCLPNTEKYFRQWFSLFIKTLMVYPIIAAIFGMANILAVVISKANEANGPVSSFAGLVSIIVLILPLFLIPYSFKLAGGAIGSLHDQFTTYRKKGHQGILGNPNNEKSLRNNAKGKYVNELRDRRADRGSALRNTTFANRNAATRGLTRLLGGGAATAENQALRNTQKAQSISQTWSSGDDTYAKASTISLNSLDAWRNDASVVRRADGSAQGRRYRRTTDGIEQWAAADGAWMAENEIREGNRRYSKGADKQANFLKLAEKTEALDTQYQDRVLEDYLQYANDAGIDEGTATGRWQGISIPLKNMRLDHRRANIGRDPTTGQLARTGTSHQGLLTEYANMSMGEQIKETPGTFDSIGESLRFARNAGRAPNAPNVDQERAASAAYHNLRNYVNGSIPGNVAAAGVAAAGAPGGAPGAAAGPGGAATYSTSSSAAAKNAGAARDVLAQIEADPDLVQWLNDPVRRPRGT